MHHRLPALVALSSALVFAGLAGAEAARQTRAAKVEKSEKTASARTMSNRECLARAMYFESNRNREDGMLAVGTIVANRLEAGRFGATLCEVVSRRAQFAPGVLSRKMVETRPAELARRVADAVLSGLRHPSAGGALFFHTHNVPFRNDDKHYVLVSGGNAFYRWSRGGTEEKAEANLKSLAEAAAAAPEDREVGEKVVETALRRMPDAGVGPEIAMKRLPPPVFVRAVAEPAQAEIAQVLSPDAAPAAPQPTVVAAADVPAADVGASKVATAIVGKPDPLARALAYRGAPAPLPVGGALAAVAALKFTHAPQAIAAAAAGQRVIAPASPVLAAATPIFAEKPAQKTPNPLANIAVAAAWSHFE